MLFNSVAFLIFFPVVTILFFILPYRYRWSLLLLASCFFYMFFKIVYIFILIFTIIIDYYAGLLIERAKDKHQKKRFLIMSIIANVGVLAVFKYYNFLNGNISGVASFFGFENHIPFLSIALPIGLSFHTFQAMSYTIEVYRGNQKAEHHFGIYALYVMFYPQLVAGPIERPQNILHQFHEKQNFNYDNVIHGLTLMAYGMFKKVVIADRLSVYVNEVYGHVNHFSTMPVLIAVLFFSFQIYCDFSGYSDIAIGAAKVMGFNLMVNFNRPYSAPSISQFWTKWHISLSTWFRDYVYIPLGGNRTSKLNWYRNLAIVFLLSGLWHGANWTFIIWGGIHAFYMLFALWTLKYRTAISKFIGLSLIPKVNHWIQVMITFCLVSFAWIFFRAKNFNHAKDILHKIGEMKISFDIGVMATDLGAFNLIVCFGVIILLFLSYLLPRNMEVKHQAPLFISFIILTILLGTNGENEFIYFQF